MLPQGQSQILTVLPELKSFTFLSALALMTMLQRARAAGANCGSLEFCRHGLLSVCIIVAEVGTAIEMNADRAEFTFMCGTQTA